MKVVSIAIAGICILLIAGSAFAEGYQHSQKRGQWCNMYDYSRWEHPKHKNRFYYQNRYNKFWQNHNYRHYREYRQNHPVIILY